MRLLALSNFRGRFVPVVPLPDGSGETSGTLGPQDTTAWAMASSYLRVLGPNVVNELRIGDTRRSVDRSATVLPTAAGEALGLPGIPDTGAISRHAADVSCQRIPAARIAAEHGIELQDERHRDRRHADVGPGPAHREGRVRLAMAEIECRPAAIADRIVHVQLDRQRSCPASTNTGASLASFLLGQVQLFTTDVQQSEIRERARFQEYFIQDEWRVSERLTIHPGLRYTLNFPSTEINGQTAVFDLGTELLDYPGTEPVRTLKKNNFGPRLGRDLPPD